MKSRIQEATMASTIGEPHSHNLINSGHHQNPSSLLDNTNDIGNTRSPAESPRPSFAESNSTRQSLGRRYSLNLPSDVVKQLERRRTSLEKLQLGKVSPWMHLYDFTEEAANENQEGARGVGK